MDILSKHGFDPEKFALGKPCVHGHILGDTGKTVRYKNSRRQCVVCAKASQARIKSEAKTEVVEPFTDPESDAILAQYGFDTSRFILGRICKKGHEFEQTGKGLRYRCSSGRYAGKPKDCVRCIEIQRGQWKEDNFDRYLENNKRYYHENREQLLENAKRYYQEHREDRIAYTRAWEQEYKQRDPEKYKKIRRKCDRNWNEKNGERYKRIRNDRFKQLYKKNPDKYKLLSSKRRSLRRKNHIGVVTKETLRTIEISFNSKCAYCQLNEFKHWDHFIPLSEGGPDATGNFVPACIRCNVSKGAKDPKEWYESQPFYSEKQWKKILKILGKTPENYNQIPLL
jgi:hypothetical protein